MKRKLVKQAGKALTLTLPIDWLRERNLQAGDELELIKRDRSLLITTDHVVAPKKLSISLKGVPFGTRYAFLAAAYARGIDELTIDTDKGVYPDLGEYLGYVVLDQSDTKLVIHDMNAGISEDIDLIFKRTFQIIMRYFDSATKHLAGDGEVVSMERIRDFDREINKLALFLQRAVMKKTMPSSTQGKLLFAYSYALERIGDEILRLWRLAVQEDIHISKEVQELFPLVANMLNKSFALYYRFNEKNIHELRRLKTKFREQAYPLFKKDANMSRFLMHLCNIFEETYDLKHLALMKEFKPE